MAQSDQMNLNIDLKSTQAIETPEGNKVFSQGVLLRKISKFVAGTSEDAIMPIPVFYDVLTGEVMVDMIPKELRDEFTKESV